MGLIVRNKCSQLFSFLLKAPFYMGYDAFMAKY